MTLVLPPIVCRYPFAHVEMTAFCDDIEVELEKKAKAVATVSNASIDLSLAPV